MLQAELAAVTRVLRHEEPGSRGTVAGVKGPQGKEGQGPELWGAGGGAGLYSMTVGWAQPRDPQESFPRC